jgi:hypothetical protein
LKTREEQDRFLARNDDPLGGKRFAGIGVASSEPAVNASGKYLNRPDIYAVTDKRQKELMAMGLTAGQAAEKLRFDVSTPGQPGYTPGLEDDRKYETLRMQAWTTETGKSAAKHTWGKDTNLPQGPNEYEYASDLFTYAEKGYPTRDKEVFSPVDYTMLGLPGGKGGQAYIWTDEKYDLRGAMDVIAGVQRRGDLGPYGNLKSTSSVFGDLSLETQKGIGAAAATSSLRSTPERVDFSVWGQTPEQMGKGTFVPILNKTPSVQKAAADTSLFSIEPAAPRGIGWGVGYDPSIETTQQSIEEWWKGIPVIGGIIPSGIFAPTSKIIQPGYAGFVRAIAPVETTNTKDFGTLTMNRSDLPKSRGADYAPVFIGADNKPSQTFTGSKGTPYMKDGQMVQDYVTADLSKVSLSRKTSVTTIGPSPAKQGWDAFQGSLSEKAYSALGSIESTIARKSISGEGAMKTHGAVTRILTSFSNKDPAFIPVAATASVGKYGLDRPADAAINVAIGVGIGGITRAAGWGYGAVARSPLAEAAISQGGKWRAALQYSDFLTGKAIPAALGGMYATDVAYRSTEGFTNFKAGSVTAKVTPILTFETIPMGIGAGIGYNAAGSMVNAARVSNRGFMDALKADTTKGRFDYYVRQPVSKPLDLVKQDYAAFVQEGGRPGSFSYMGERIGMNKPVTPEVSRPTMAPENEFITGNAYGKTSTIFDMMGVGKTPKPEPKTLGGYALSEYAGQGAYGKQRTLFDAIDSATRKGGHSNRVSGKYQPITMGSPATRMSTRTVGGKQTSGLRPEPSLSKQMRDAVDIPAGKTSSSSIGKRTDFRNMPQGKEAPYRKMSSMQIQMSEELPQVTGLTQGKMAAPQQRSFPLLQVPRTEFMQSYDQRKSQGIMFEVLQGQKAGQVQRQAQEQMFAQQSRRTNRDEGIMIANLSGRLVKPASATAYEQMFKPASDQIYRSSSKTAFDTRSAFDQLTRTTQTPRTTTTPRTTPITTPRPRLTPKPVPIPFILPPLSGGGTGGGIRGRGGRRLTQVFSVNFGKVTESLFGKKPAYAARKRKTSKTKSGKRRI